MSVYAVQFESFWTDSLPRDSTINVVHLRDTGDSDGSLLEGVIDDATNDWETTAQSFAQQWHDAHESVNSGGLVTGRGVRCKIYRLAFTGGPDSKLVYGEPLGRGYVAATGNMSAAGNRDVALCLSYYGTENTPRHRGRIYLGPYGPTYAGAQHPVQTVIDGALAFHTVIGAFQLHRDSPLANADLDWVVFSKRAQTSYRVHAGWVDNEWDTQRRRGLKPTSRTAFTSGG